MTAGRTGGASWSTFSAQPDHVSDRGDCAHFEHVDDVRARPPYDVSNRHKGDAFIMVGLSVQYNAQPEAGSHRFPDAFSASDLHPVSWSKILIPARVFEE